MRVKDRINFDGILRDSGRAQRFQWEKRGTSCDRSDRICPVGLPMAGNLLGCFRIIERPFDRQGRCRSVNSQLLWKTLWKKGHEDWNSLISNEKDQAAHKSVYYCKLVKLQALIKFSEIRVPVGKDSSASPAKTEFSTIGLREWPTGRGFWESGPCRSNSCGAFVRMDVNKRCQPCVRSSHGRAPTLGQGWDTSVRKWEMAASVDQIV